MSAPDTGLTPEVPPPPPEVAKISDFGRVIGVIHSPGETFADIARKPSFVLPVIIMMLLITVASQVTIRRIGLENIIRQQISKSPRAADMSKAQLDAAVEMGLKIGSITQWINFIFIPIVMAIVAGVLLLMSNFIFGGKGGFKQMFAVVAHSWVPPGVVASILGIVVAFLKDPSDIDVENPIAANLGLLISADTSKFLHRFGVSMDLFSFWQMFLLAVGIAAVAKHSFTKSLLAVGIPWIIFVLCASGWAAR